MYKALKSAQYEIQEILLKFMDETQPQAPTQGQTLPQLKARVLPQVQAMPQAQAMPETQDSNIQLTQSLPQSKVQAQTQDSDIQLTTIIQTLGFLHDKQNAQFKTLVDEIKVLNHNITSIVSILMNQAVTTSTKIPSLQPTGDVADLKTIHLEPSIHGDENNDVEIESEAELELEVEPEVEPEMEVEAETEVEPEVEAETEVDQEETGIEVEEWTFRGRVFFKDSENTVYANDNGEIGDPIGQYDPVKNVVKKITIN